MKTLTSIFLVIILFIATSFIAREKEENLNPEFLMFQNEECFADFLLNLKKMEALIFIPENKIELAKTFNLVPVAPKRAKNVNINFLKAYKRYQMVKPEMTSEKACSEPVTYSFNNLEMKIFVRKNTNLDRGGSVGVTPVPLPMPKPELKANVDDVSYKVTRNTNEFEHKVIDRNASEFEAKLKENETDLTAKLAPEHKAIPANESRIAFQEERALKFYVPVRIK